MFFVNCECVLNFMSFVGMKFDFGVVPKRNIQVHHVGGGDAHTANHIFKMTTAKHSMVCNEGGAAAWLAPVATATTVPVSSHIFFCKIASMENYLRNHLYDAQPILSIACIGKSYFGNYL